MPCHFIVVPMSAFGHVVSRPNCPPLIILKELTGLFFPSAFLCYQRPKLSLACNLIRLSDTVYITFLVLAYYLPKLVPEIARHGLTAEQESRIDCVGLGDPNKVCSSQPHGVLAIQLLTEPFGRTE
jgi:hypothetical protein